MSRAQTKPTAILDPDEPSGTVIASGVVPGRAIPWKAPKTNRQGRTIRDRGYKTFETWKQVVQLSAIPQRRRKKLYSGPVELITLFYLHNRPGASPDLTNMIKAFEDALQDVIYRNDRQVVAHQSEKILSSTEAERVEWEVRAR